MDYRYIQPIIKTRILLVSVSVLRLFVSFSSVNSFFWNCVCSFVCLDLSLSLSLSLRVCVSKLLELSSCGRPYSFLEFLENVLFVGTFFPFFLGNRKFLLNFLLN